MHYPCGDDEDWIKLYPGDSESTPIREVYISSDGPFAKSFGGHGDLVVCKPSGDSRK